MHSVSLFFSTFCIVPLDTFQLTVLYLRPIGKEPGLHSFIRNWMGISLIHFERRWQRLLEKIVDTRGHHKRFVSVSLSFSSRCMGHLRSFGQRIAFRCGSKCGSENKWCVSNCKPIKIFRSRRGNTGAPPPHQTYITVKRVMKTTAVTASIFNATKLGTYTRFHTLLCGKSTTYTSLSHVWHD